jgi:membrane protease YdiL (CAAX protease family)
MTVEIKNARFESFGHWLQGTALARPVAVSVGLFAIALFFRWIDGFVLRLDEILGELILTKSLGFGLVLLFLYLTGRKLKHIGMHAGFWYQNLLMGIGITTGAFIVGYAVEAWLATRQGLQPALVFGAIDSKMGVTGGTLFAFWMLFCNAVNAFMEEGLFRGLLGRLGRLRFGLWGANWFQAIFFSIWHLPWVLKYYIIGEIQTPGEIGMSILFHSLPQLLIGLFYGYLYLKTNSLWAPWAAHALSNTVLNFLHVTTAEGMDVNIPIRMCTYLLVVFLSLIWVRRHSHRFGAAAVEPWS